MTLFSAACSQTAPVNTSVVRQSDASADTDVAATTNNVKMVDTTVLPDVNTGVPTVSSSASIASSTETTDNECECHLMKIISCHFRHLTMISE